MIAHPHVPPAPLRGSRKPLPSTGTAKGAIPTAPPASFYTPYLDSLSQSSSTPEASGTTIWQSFFNTEQSTHDDTQEQKPAVDWSKRSAALEADLEGIPAEFFETDFDLASPLIWDMIIHLSDSSSAHKPETSHEDENANILSRHLDVLEKNLVDEISLRAPVFFSALSNLEALSTQSSACLSRISSLTSSLNDMDQHVPIQGLCVARGRERLHSLRTIDMALTQAQMGSDILDLSTQLCSHLDWAGTLDSLQDLGRWWARCQGVNPDGSEDLKKQGDGHLSQRQLDDIVEEEGDEGSDPQDDGAHQNDTSSRSCPIPLDKTTFGSVIQTRAQELLGQLKTQLEGLIAEQLLTALQSEEQQDTNIGLPIEVHDKFRAFKRCGGSVETIVGVWRTACLRTIREGLRQVSQSLIDVVLHMLTQFLLRQHLQPEEDLQESGAIADSTPGKRYVTFVCSLSQTIG